ncbi:MAG: NAD(P)-dependent oxidoreductase [Bacteroidia bacterium]|nr:NAD(P)-dependent oxidoreductase [Bacteroidia bacterium]
MKVLITGAHGLLGQKLALVLGAETRWELLLTDLAPRTFFINERFDYQQLDITIRTDVKSLIAAYKPDVIINTAAMTDVDGCETDKVAAWSLNTDALKHLIIGARRIEGCRIVQLSTDYVFDGRSGPYDEQSRPAPLSYYGKSKLAAENALRSSGVDGLIVRTQVLYGTGYEVRKNFVSWVLSQLEKNTPFKVVDDQTGNPTLADDLAWGILKLIERGCSGVYHVSGPEAITRFSFARKIADIFGFQPGLITRTTSAEIGQAANRPMDSTFITLKFEAATGTRLGDTAQGLERLRYQIRDGAEHTGLLSDPRFK